MADSLVIDYYGILNLPPSADLHGIESAYARLSGELAELSVHDEGHRDALKRVNEAYSVLSTPTLRREYDTVFRSKELQAEIAARRRFVRRRQWMQRTVLAGLLLIVVAQAGALAYLGREQVSVAAEAVFGPLMPGDAG